MIAIEVRQADGTWWRYAEGGQVRLFTSRYFAEVFAFGGAYNRAHAGISRQRRQNVRYVSI